MLITQDGQTPVVGLLEDFLSSLVQGRPSKWEYVFPTAEFSYKM